MGEVKGSSTHRSLNRTGLLQSALCSESFDWSRVIEISEPSISLRPQMIARRLQPLPRAGT